MASVAQDLVDEAIREGLAQADVARACCIVFLVPVFGRLRTQLFTAVS